MATIRAKTALTADGWQGDVALDVEGGRIVALRDGGGGPYDADILLPALANVHSHAFQRAMAGLTETRGGAAHDDFWSWRRRMYAFLARLTPEDVEVIAAGLYVEMLEAGFCAVGEFHYLHNAPDGQPYDNPAEMAERIVAAAGAAGIGLTLLPVAYLRGGVDGRPLAGGQRRFDADVDLVAQIRARVAGTLAADGVLGTAPHSLRAVPDHVVRDAAALPGPLHIHVAEQIGEVAEILAATGRTPTTHLLDLVEASPRWTLIHATHASPEELGRVASAGATVGLCPVTESNLGDGIFAAPAFLAAGGRFAVGSDSNVRISVSEELRTLDHSQRLALRQRCPLAAPGASEGRLLYATAAHGGATSLGRGAGRIAAGELADLVALDGDNLALAGLSGDAILDAFIFAGDDRAVRHVWSAGRHVVQGGRHVARDAVMPKFAARLAALRQG